MILIHHTKNHRQYPVTLGPVRWLAANVKEPHVAYMTLAAGMSYIIERTCYVYQCAFWNSAGDELAMV